MNKDVRARLYGIWADYVRYRVKDFYFHSGCVARDDLFGAISRKYLMHHAAAHSDRDESLKITTYYIGINRVSTL